MGSSSAISLANNLPCNAWPDGYDGVSAVCNGKSGKSIPRALANLAGLGLS